MVLELTWAGFLLGVLAGLLLSFIVLVLLLVRHAKKTKPVQDIIRDAALRNLGEKN